MYWDIFNDLIFFLPIRTKFKKDLIVKLVEKKSSQIQYKLFYSALYSESNTLFFSFLIFFFGISAECVVEEKISDYM